MKRTAIYAGSFDPITNGHLWMILEGARLFDCLTVLVADNPSKKCLFNLSERERMVNESIRDVSNVNVTSAPNHYVASIAEVGEDGEMLFMLRGIRTVADFDYERALRLINSDIAPKVQTVFLMPPRDVAEVSSSLVKGLVGPKGWEKVVRRYVPKVVLQELKKSHG